MKNWKIAVLFDHINHEKLVCLNFPSSLFLSNHLYFKWLFLNHKRELCWSMVLVPLLLQQIHRLTFNCFNRLTWSFLIFYLHIYHSICREYQWNLRNQSNRVWVLARKARGFFYLVILLNSTMHSNWTEVLISCLL